MIDAAACASRVARVAGYLDEHGIAAARFEDFEGARSPVVRYLTGHPGDAFLVVTADARTILIAWDVNMARRRASVDRILAYTDFGRNPVNATKAVLGELGLRRGGRVSLGEATPYLRFIDYVEALDDFDPLCESGGVDGFVRSMRAVKDAGELEIYRRASLVTDRLMDEIEEGLRSGVLASETDVALFIERECRCAGCEGTGFETIAAGPARSFGIHAVPAYGAGPFATEGMSILDFGVRLQGYTTDVTMTFVRGDPGPVRRRMIELVGEACESAVRLCGPGVAARSIAGHVDALFSRAGMSMPHGLGHGIGLEAHEAPGINMRPENDAVLVPGNIVTIEPGLYDPELGGVRLEHDILVTEHGFEALTHSRIVFLD